MVLSPPENTRTANNDSYKADVPSAEIQGTQGTSSTVLGTTAFQDDAAVRVNEVRSMPFTDHFNAKPQTQQYIREFMAKPRPIITGVFQGTDAVNSVLENFSIATALFAAPIWTNKISGFGLVRGTAIVRLVVNANPFQAGRLLLHLLPCESDVNDAAGGTTRFSTMHNMTLTQKTQQPNVELDLRDATCELRIPYITPMTYHDVGGRYDWGNVRLSVLSPFLTGSSGETQCEYTIFLSFEDFELAAPTFNLESGLIASMKNLSFERSNVASSRLVPSVLAEQVSKAAGVFSDVPVLGKVADFVGDVAGRIGKTLSIFGWSKPLDLGVVGSVARRPWRHMQNADGINGGDNFGLTANQSADPFPGFAGTTSDEMTMAFLKKISAYVSSFTWDTTDVSGTRILTIPVRPFLGVSGTTLPVGFTYTWQTLTPIGHVGRYFKQWRGSLRITLKFVKTQFHSGRLVVAFDPSMGTATPTIANSQYMMREIIDVRNSSEITLTLPYMKARSFLNCEHDTSTAPSNTLGYLHFFVLNELRAPETVAPEIDVLVYLSGGDDFEYAVPIPQVWQQFSPESGLNADTAYIDKGIGDFVPDKPSALPALISQGEIFTSIKQLLNCSRRIYTGDASSTSMSTIRFWPDLNGLALPTTGLVPIRAGVVGDYVADLSHGYLLRRGGSRLSSMAAYATGTLIAMANPTVPGTTCIDFSAYSVSPTRIVATPITLANPTVVRETTTAVADFVMPQYTCTISRLNVPAPTNVPNLPDSYPWTYQHVAISQTGDGPDYAFMRGCADDFALGYFIGFPAVLTNVVAN